MTAAGSRLVEVGPVEVLRLDLASARDLGFELELANDLDEEVDVVVLLVRVQVEQGEQAHDRGPKVAVPERPLREGVALVQRRENRHVTVAASLERERVQESCEIAGQTGQISPDGTGVSGEARGVSVGVGVGTVDVRQALSFDEVSMVLRHLSPLLAYRSIQ